VAHGQKKEEFGDRLRLCRKKRGFTQAELAKKIHIGGHAPVSRYESGKSVPDLNVLIEIEKTLHIDLHELITGKPSPKLMQALELLSPSINERIDKISERSSVLHSLTLGYRVRESIHGEDHSKAIEAGEDELRALQAELLRFQSLFFPRPKSKDTL